MIGIDLGGPDFFVFVKVDHEFLQLGQKLADRLIVGLHEEINEANLRLSAVCRVLIAEIGDLNCELSFLVALSAIHHPA